MLRNGAVLSTTFGLALAATAGQAAAMNKAELIEQMASEAGVTSSEMEAVLNAFINATTKALSTGESAVLVGFGAFSISKRSARTGRRLGSGNGPADTEPVTFDPCPEFAAALDLNPGNGDEASAKCRDADVVIDAAYLASQTDGEVSKADAKRALDAFVKTTTKALKKGDRLSLNRFGSFSVTTKALKKGDRLSAKRSESASISKRSARTGRNPQTGKEIQIAAKNVVKFKAGAELSKAVN